MMEHMWKIMGEYVEMMENNNRKLCGNDGKYVEHNGKICGNDGKYVENNWKICGNDGK